MKIRVFEFYGAIGEVVNTADCDPAIFESSILS